MKVAPSSPQLSRLIAGVDEAGRGAKIGPLVVAVVALSKETEALLQQAGVRDSKYLTANVRAKFAALIKQHAEEWHVRHISASEIDQGRSCSTLNDIQTQATADLIRGLSCREQGRLKAIVADAYDTNAERFATTLKQTFPGVKVVGEHRADAKFVVCAAASILAKVERDEAIARLQQQFSEPLGSGYPADRTTQAFLQTYASFTPPLSPLNAHPSPDSSSPTIPSPTLIHSSTLLTSPQAAVASESSPAGSPSIQCEIRHSWKSKITGKEPRSTESNSSSGSIVVSTGKVCEYNTPDHPDTPDQPTLALSTSSLGRVTIPQSANPISSSATLPKRRKISDSSPLATSAPAEGSADGGASSAEKKSSRRVVPQVAWTIITE